MTTQQDRLMETFDSRARRREDRRAFFTAALGAAAVGSAFLYADPAKAQSANVDFDVLNFALNLEYLEAQFYLYAVNGSGLPADMIASGSGTAGGTTTGGQKVDFSGDPLVGAYAKEIAADEMAHVKFLRGALKTSAVAMPNINIAGDAGGSFTAAARAAGVVGMSDTFNPYSSPNNFLLGAFIFEDVGVTAYKGAAPLVTDKTFLEAAAGILAVEAYHAAIVRTTLYAKGMATPSLKLIEATEAISNARDSLDGTDDRDQGVADVTTGVGATSNIAPLDSNGLAFSRSTGQVLNIVYLSPNQVTMGGFFPAGVNGNIKTSAGAAS